MPALVLALCDQTFHTYEYGGGCYGAVFTIMSDEKPKQREESSSDSEGESVCARPDVQPPAKKVCTKVGICSL